MSVSCIKVENVEKHVLILVVAAAVARSMVNGECEPRTQCIANAIAFNFILICDPIGGMSVFACDRQHAETFHLFHLFHFHLLGYVRSCFSYRFLSTFAYFNSIYSVRQLMHKPNIFQLIEQLILLYGWLTIRLAACNLTYAKDVYISNA